jgi:hypothetical protein
LKLSKSARIVRGQLPGKVQDMVKAAFLTLALLLAQAPAKNASLQIEAALVYRNGDVKPVARVQVLVLDASLARILADAGLTMPWVREARRRQ